MIIERDSGLGRPSFVCELHEFFQNFDFLFDVVLRKPESISAPRSRSLGGHPPGQQSRLFVATCREVLRPTAFWRVILPVPNPIRTTKEFDMKPSVISGASIAAAAAALIFTVALAPAANAAAGGQGHCVGANACKGKSACKSAKNACNGKNGCKGQGFLVLTKAQCDKIEGAKFEPNS